MQTIQIRKGKDAVCFSKSAVVYEFDLYDRIIALDIHGVVTIYRVDHRGATLGSIRVHELTDNINILIDYMRTHRNLKISLDDIVDGLLDYVIPSCQKTHTLD